MEAGLHRDDHDTSEIKRRVDKLCGAEQFLVGISPQYWSHTSMSIGTLCTLGLVDGIDCFVVRNSAKTDGAHSTDTATFTPVSKCHLLGVITNVDRKSNGSCQYLLDDGTGMIDCLQWGNNDMYALPSLAARDDPEPLRSEFHVGQRVRVMGKIQCVSIGHVRERVQVGGTTWDVRHCIREVQMTSISTADSGDAEADHWLRSCQFLHRLNQDVIHSGTAATLCKVNPVRVDVDDDVRYVAQQTCEPILNGVGVLRLLGTEIAGRAMQRSDFPASDDAFGAWRLFGTDCQCQLEYKESLLYCHCQATHEPLDPQFVFRDAVLNLLVGMEHEIPSLPSRGEVELNTMAHLVFEYKVIVDDRDLQQTAANVLRANGTSNVSAGQSRLLFLKTFSALRCDGVLHLIDTVQDKYLLMSRERVLDPYYRITIDKSGESFELRGMLQSEPPAYIALVPHARAQYVKKLLSENL